MNNFKSKLIETVLIAPELKRSPTGTTPVDICITLAFVNKKNASRFKTDFKNYLKRQVIPVLAKEVDLSYNNIINLPQIEKTVNGNKELALMLVALGYHYKWWSLKTPKTADPSISREMAVRLALRGVFQIALNRVEISDYLPNPPSSDTTDN